MGRWIFQGQIDEAVGWFSLGVPIFVYNNANAAAVVSYVRQDDYENILLQRHPIGYSVGGRAS